MESEEFSSSQVDALLYRLQHLKKRPTEAIQLLQKETQSLTNLLGAAVESEKPLIHKIQQAMNNMNGLVMPIAEDMAHELQRLDLKCLGDRIIQTMKFKNKFEELLIRRIHNLEFRLAQNLRDAQEIDRGACQMCKLSMNFQKLEAIKHRMGEDDSRFFTTETPVVKPPVEETNEFESDEIIRRFLQQKKEMLTASSSNLSCFLNQTLKSISNPLNPPTKSHSPQDLAIISRHSTGAIDMVMKDMGASFSDWTKKQLAPVLAVICQKYHQKMKKKQKSLMVSQEIQTIQIKAGMSSRAYELKLDSMRKQLNQKKLQTNALNQEIIKDKQRADKIRKDLETIVEQKNQKIFELEQVVKRKQELMKKLEDNLSETTVQLKQTHRTSVLLMQDPQVRKSIALRSSVFMTGRLKEEKHNILMGQIKEQKNDAVEEISSSTMHDQNELETLAPMNGYLSQNMTSIQNSRKTSFLKNIERTSRNSVQSTKIKTLMHMSPLGTLGSDSPVAKQVKIVKEILNGRQNKLDMNHIINKFSVQQQDTSSRNSQFSLRNDLTVRAQPTAEQTAQPTQRDDKTIQEQSPRIQPNEHHNEPPDNFSYPKTELHSQRQKIIQNNVIDGNPQNTQFQHSQPTPRPQENPISKLTQEQPDLISPQASYHLVQQLYNSDQMTHYIPHQIRQSNKKKQASSSSTIKQKSMQIPIKVTRAQKRQSVNLSKQEIRNSEKSIMVTKHNLTASQWTKSPPKQLTARESPENQKDKRKRFQNRSPSIIASEFVLPDFGKNLVKRNSSLRKIVIKEKQNIRPKVFRQISHEEFGIDDLGLFQGLSEAYMYENKKPEKRIYEVDLEQEEWIKKIYMYVDNLRKTNGILYKNLKNFLYHPYQTAVNKMLSMPEDFKIGYEQFLQKILRILDMHKKCDSAGRKTCQHINNFLCKIGYTMDSGGISVKPLLPSLI